MTVEHRIILTGGGTGGHVYPALAIADELKEKGVKSILYIGARGHLEERLAAERSLDFVGLSVSGLPRKPSARLLFWPFKTASAIFCAVKLMREFRPTAVIGTGGYASAPPLAAAGILGVPYAIHEPDAHPGLVNRTFARGAALVSLGMEGAKASLSASARGKVAVNGNPVRASFISPPSRQKAAQMLDLRPDLRTVLVTGGSQGAHAINQSVKESLPRLIGSRSDIQIVHQVGDKNLSEYLESLPGQFLNNDRYQVRAYFSDLAVAYALSDLTVARSGAMTISELTVTGTPAIFVPYPHAAQNHQEFNARSIERQGGAVVLLQSELKQGRLAEAICALLDDEGRLRDMRATMLSLGRPHAAADIAAQLIELSNSYGAMSGRTA